MSTSADASASDEFRESVLVAAYDELTRWGIDRFSIVALADRHGLDMALIQRHWANAERLVLDVLLDMPNRERIAPPDTGSLRNDLFALALGMASYVSSEIGRSLQVTHLIENPNLPTADIRRAVWRARSGSLRIVFDRARDRGEMLDGVDPLTALELLFAPINMRELFTGEPVDEHYCRTVADLVYRAVAT
jgi:hypothetical protein